MRLNKEQGLQIGVGLTSFGIGLIVGHIWTKRITKPKPEEELKETQLELDFKRADQDKEFNWKIQQLNHVIDKFDNSMQKADNVVDQFQDSGEIFLGRFIRQEDQDNAEEVTMRVIENIEESAVVSVFTDGDDEDWNYDVELAARNPEFPYTIHRDEFFENPNENRQSVLTFYMGDKILCDELDSPIYNPEKIVGRLEFGRGSQDPNVVYVRNERLLADYEILLDHGYYQVEVLGQQVENGLNADDLKHSIQKFRFE